MAQADPFVDDPKNQPYKCLGIPPNASYEKAKEALIDLYGKHQDLKSRHKNKNPKKAEHHQKAIRNMKTALEAIKEPPGADEPIELEIETTDPAVGEPVTLKVTGDQGPVETIVEATDGNDLNKSKQTSPATGQATFRFQREGSVQFTALTTDAYDDATAALSVAQQDLSLAFDNLPDAVEVNEAVDIAVMADGEAVDATVLADGTNLGRTKGDALKYAFDSTGTYKLTASKQPDNRAEYTDATTQLNVTEEQVEISVAVEGNDYELGGEVVVHVTEVESGAPVPQAEVTIGTQTRKTNATGEARLSLEAAGSSVTIEATKPAEDEDRTYRDGETEIEVSKKQAGLHIESIEGKQMEQATLTIQIIDNQGHSLEDATISTDWGHKETTDDNGEARIELEDDGRLTITAEKETHTVDYGTDSRTLKIGEFTRELVIASAPSVKNPGETATIHITDNAGNDVANATVTSSEQIGKEWTTDEDGTVSFTLTNQPGTPTITVKKTGDDFNIKTTTNIRILP